MFKTISATLALSAVLLLSPGLASAHNRYDRDQYRSDYYRGDYNVVYPNNPRWGRCGRGYEFFRGRCYWVGYPHRRDDRHDRRDHRRHAW